MKIIISNNSFEKESESNLNNKGSISVKDQQILDLINKKIEEFNFGEEYVGYQP